MTLVARAVYPLDWVSLALLREWWEDEDRAISETRVCQDLWRTEAATDLRFAVTRQDVWHAFWSLGNMGYVIGHEHATITAEGARYLWRRVGQFSRRNPEAMRVLEGSVAAPASS